MKSSRDVALASEYGKSVTLSIRLKSYTADLIPILQELYRTYDNQKMSQSRIIEIALVEFYDRLYNSNIYNDKE